MNPLFKILKVDTAFDQFDKKVEELGWANGCLWLIKSLKIDYTISPGIPKAGAVLIYANHPTGLDPYLLTAVLERNDSYFWGDIYQSKKGKNVARHVIPIAPKPSSSIIRRPLTNWPGYVYMRLTTPSLSRVESLEINKKSIDRTIELLRKKNQVIIFPSGGEYEFLRQKKGLSILLKKCRQLEIPVKTLKLKIKNFGELSLLFHFLLKTKIKAEIK